MRNKTPMITHVNITKRKRADAMGRPDIQARLRQPLVRGPVSPSGGVLPVNFVFWKHFLSRRRVTQALYVIYINMLDCIHFGFVYNFVCAKFNPASKSSILYFERLRRFIIGVK